MSKRIDELKKQLMKMEAEKEVMQAEAKEMATKFNKLNLDIELTKARIEERELDKKKK